MISSRSLLTIALTTLCTFCAATAAAEPGGGEGGALPPRQLQAAPGFEGARPGAAPGFEEEHTSPTTAWGDLALKQAIVPRDDEARVATIRERHGVDVSSDDLLAFEGKFSRRASETPELVVLDRDREELRLYRGRSVAVRQRGLDLPSDSELEQLGAPAAALPVEVVRDGTLQILVWRKGAPELPVPVRSSDEEKKPSARARVEHYHLTAYKVIGDYFGRPLDRVIARRDTPDAGITVTTQLSFAEGKRHLDVIETPLDDAGAPIEEKRQRLYWNHWEGAFTPPRPIPTAPRREAPRT